MSEVFGVILIAAIPFGLGRFWLFVLACVALACQS